MLSDVVLVEIIKGVAAILVALTWPAIVLVLAWPIRKYIATILPNAIEKLKLKIANVEIEASLKDLNQAALVEAETNANLVAIEEVKSAEVEPAKTEAPAEIEKPDIVVLTEEVVKAAEKAGLKRVNVQVRLPASRSFDAIYSAIHGSQLKFLHELKQGPMTIQDVSLKYNFLVWGNKRTDDMTNSYKLWLRFLMVSELIELQDLGSFALTERGKEFIEFAELKRNWSDRPE